MFCLDRDRFLLQNREIDAFIAQPFVINKYASVLWVMFIVSWGNRLKVLFPVNKVERMGFRTEEKAWKLSGDFKVTMVFSSLKWTRKQIALRHYSSQYQLILVNYSNITLMSILSIQGMLNIYIVANVLKCSLNLWTTGRKFEYTVLSLFHRTKALI